MSSSQTVQVVAGFDDDDDAATTHHHRERRRRRQKPSILCLKEEEEDEETEDEATTRHRRCASRADIHGAGADWELSIDAMEKAQRQGSWESACSLLRIPFGPLLHTLSYVSGIELARLETACPPLARTRMCESASKAMVVSSVTQQRKGFFLKAHDVLARVRGGQSWKQLTGWIGSPPAWSVLQDLFESTDGSSWEWSEGWSDSDVDVSTWFGVTAKSGRVVGLALFSNSLRGEIPPSLGSLSNLRELLLHHNQLVGSVPAALGSLERLETLDLSANKLNGELKAGLFPPSSRLQYLNLSANRLSGRIPEAISNLTKLEALHLNHNSFTGALPATLGKLHRLEVFNASHCWLTSELPSSMARLLSLKVLFVGHNRLSGSLDVLAGLCSSCSDGGAPSFSSSAASKEQRGKQRESSSSPSSSSEGALREVYANDNNLDVANVHPRLRSHLSVLFVDRNKKGIEPRDAGVWSTADLQREVARISAAAAFQDDHPL